MEPHILLLTQLLPWVGNPSDAKVTTLHREQGQTILAVFAHPDDETWVAGTLAKLADRGVEVIPVYATSGDAGDDFSGESLTGSSLAKIRETEALQATHALGLSRPIFLRYPDGNVDQYQTQIRDQLTVIMDEHQPMAVISFGAEGVTGHMDHIKIGEIVRELSEATTANFAVSASRADLFAEYATKHGIPFTISHPVADAEITYQVDVGNYSEHRIKAQASYKSQFPPIMMQAFADFVKHVPTEELVIPVAS